MIPKSSLAISMCLVLANCSPSAQSELDATVSVAVLVDISKSFAPLSLTDVTALEQLQRAVEKAVASATWNPPVTIYWSTIGNSGVLAGSSVCGSALFRPLMVSKSQTAEFSSVAQLQAWFRECTRALVSRSQDPEAYTDISGSVAIAAENGRRVKGRKLIVVLSDFAEDLPSGSKPADFALSGETVVMLYRAQPSDAKDSNLLFSRLKQWEDRFTKAGAKSTCRVPITGATATTIGSCF